MILDLDAGNTCIKWRLRHTDAVIGEGRVEDIEALPAAVPLHGGRPTRVRVVSVRDEKFARALESLVGESWQVQAEFAGVGRRCAGVSNAYADPARLGVDRWLAMIAAWNAGEGFCAVIDCGTAVTLDVVGEDGVHQGGYIVPGLALQCAALTGKTRIRLGHAPQWSGIRPGHSTEDAVYNGVMAMLVGWLGNEAHVRRAQSAGRLYLTGGGMQHLMPHLEKAGVSGQQSPDLVLDGLNRALP